MGEIEKKMGKSDKMMETTNKKMGETDKMKRKSKRGRK